MWAQEGRVRPVINMVKSPFGLYWPAGGFGCESVLNILEVVQQGPQEAAEKSWPGEKNCRLSGDINDVVRQQLGSRQEGRGTWTKRWMERRSGIIGPGWYRRRNGASAPWACRSAPARAWITGKAWVTGERWQRWVTACLFLLPFWHRSQAPLTAQPVRPLVWVPEWKWWIYFLSLVHYTDRKRSSISVCRTRSLHFTSGGSCLYKHASEILKRS